MRGPSTGVSPATVVALRSSVIWATASTNSGAGGRGVASGVATSTRPIGVTAQGGPSSTPTPSSSAPTSTLSRASSVCRLTALLAGAEGPVASSRRQVAVRDFASLGTLRVTGRRPAPLVTRGGAGTAGPVSISPYIGPCGRAAATQGPAAGLWGTPAPVPAADASDEQSAVRGT